ncbi:MULTISPECIES: bestrophin family ion channel [unclassified Salinisphaera]|uniref:bestrophin family protein n=1 Tax=unclassified Salinisphaera TaxID=2649847 RepID=UPI003340200B
MIIPTVPGFRHILTGIWWPLLWMFVWDVLITLLYFAQPERYQDFQSSALSRTTLTLFGTGIVLFLGFRSNSAYARWWEGRVLWGLMINASRNITRCALAFIDSADARARELREAIVTNQVAYVHVLRCQLRGTDRAVPAYRILDAKDAERMLEMSNAANALLNENARLAGQARAEGYIDTIQQSRLEAVNIDIANAQGGMERIKNTPLPMQYRLFPQMFVRLFCILLPIGIAPYLGIFTPIGSSLVALMFLAALHIGDELVDPFANNAHDLPLEAMCTTIEIDLMESIGRPAPPAVEPVNGVLW